MSKHTILFLAVTICNNTIVKLQVYELMCALCVFSTDGMNFVKSVLSHIKVKIFVSYSLQHFGQNNSNKINLYLKMNQELRHDCEIVVMELQQADTFAYQTTLMAFVNCLILVEQNLRRRMCIRNEFLGMLKLCYIT